MKEEVEVLGSPSPIRLYKRERERQIDRISQADYWGNIDHHRKLCRLARVPYTMISLTCLPHRCVGRCCNKSKAVIILEEKKTVPYSAAGLVS